MPRKSSAALAFSTTSTAARLRPPDDLTGPERKLFVDLVLGCRPDHFQPTDAPLLAAYCRAVCLEQTASTELPPLALSSMDVRAAGSTFWRRRRGRSRSIRAC